MRAGYTTVLATRILGQAPLLGPATPSRFEPSTRPDGADPDLATDFQFDPPTPMAAEPAAGQRPPGPPQPGRNADEADAPLLGFDRIAPHRDPVDDPAAADTTSSRPTAPGALQHRPRPDPPLLPLRRSSAHGDIDGTPGQRQPPPTGTDARPSVSSVPAPAGTPATPTSSGTVQDVAVTRRVEPEDRSTMRASMTTEPPIVVRIGRLDVRAVPAPPPPPPARPDTRTRHPAGPTLEQRLAARDRR